MARHWHPNDDDVTLGDAADTDSYAGALVRWTTGANDGSRGSVRPQGFSWNRNVAAKLVFPIAVYNSGDYDIYVRANTGNRNTWIWVEVNGQQHAVGPRSFGRFNLQSNGFRWSDGGGDNRIPLVADVHTITLYSIHAIDISRIAVVPAGNTSIVHNMTGDGGQSIVIGNDAVKNQPDTYLDWKMDQARNGHRCLLIENTHVDGTLGFSSLPYMTDDLPYDDTINATSDPYIEESLGAGRDVGDVLIHSEYDDLSRYRFRGYSSRWLYGDDEWPIEKFQLINTSIITACRPQGGGNYKFELLSGVEIYDRTFHVDDDLLRNETAEASFAWLLAQWNGSGSIQYINLDPSDIDVQVSWIVTENLTMKTVIENLCRSLNAQYRVSQYGELEIFRPDRTESAVLDLTDHSVVTDSLTVTNIRPAYKRVVILYGADLLETFETQADTGTFAEEIIIETYLADIIDVQALADALVQEYSSDRIDYELRAEAVTDVLLVGDLLTITHPTLHALGIVQRIQRSQLRDESLIVVRV